MGFFDKGQASLPALLAKGNELVEAGILVNDLRVVGWNTIGERVFGKHFEVIVTPFLLQNDRRIACRDTREV